MRNPDLAGLTHHRPPDEALHEPSTDQQPRHRGGESRFQYGHRLSHRAEPTPAVATSIPSGPAAPRSAGWDLGERGGADAQGRAWAAADCRVRRDAPASSGAEREGPPHAGAPDPG